MSPTRLSSSYPKAATPAACATMGSQGASQEEDSSTTSKEELLRSQLFVPSGTPRRTSFVNTLEEVPSSERCVPGATGAPGPRERRPPTQDERQERTLRMQSVRSTAPTAARAKRFIAHRSAQESGSSPKRQPPASSSPPAPSSPPASS